MHIEGEAKLLRIFVGESDLINHAPVYEKIVLEARKAGLAGATVTKGISGFGASSRIHTTKLLRLSEDLPLVIEIVDEEKKIEEFIPVLNRIFDDANSGGMITMERVNIIKYTVAKKNEA
jgi:PII-like signaling protein